MPGPGWSPLRTVWTTYAVAAKPKIGPNARNQEPPTRPWMANMTLLSPPTLCFMTTASNPEATPTSTAQSIKPLSDFIQVHARSVACRAAA